MKKALLTIFFLWFSYPTALIYQFIAGGFVGWLVATLTGGDPGSRTTGLVGAGAFIFAGLLVYLLCRPRNLNGRLPLLLLPLLLAGAAGCARPGGPNAEQVAETRTAQRADTAWATVTKTENGWDATRAR